MGKVSTQNTRQKFLHQSGERLKISYFQKIFFTESSPKSVTLKPQHLVEMSLQFSVDELIQPLVSLSSLSSDDETEVDFPLSETEVDQAEDSDIEVIACYREAPISISQRVGGREMTLDLSGCVDSGSQIGTACSQGCSFDSEPNSEMIDLVLGEHPPTGGLDDLNLGEDA